MARIHVYHDGQANRSSRIALSNDSVFNNLYYPRPSILLSQEKNHLTNKKNRILGVNRLNSKLKHRIAQTSILLGRLQEILESWHNMQYESG